MKKFLQRFRPLFSFVKAVAVLLSYFIADLLNRFIHEGDKTYLGQILACTAVIVVMDKENLKKTLQTASMRVWGTLIGAIISCIYLTIFDFSILGMILTIFILNLICNGLNIPDDGKMATVTLVVILVSSTFVNDMSPVELGVLRFTEYAVGALIGVFSIWCLTYVERKYNIPGEDEDDTISEDIQK